MKRTTFRALKEFAAQVGLKLRRELHEDGPEYVLYDAKGEALVTEFDSADVIDSITSYAGSHRDFESALSKCRGEVAS